MGEPFDPLVSIVIPVFNGADFLAQAIDSALAQTYGNIEILVVNDGSNDDGKTREIALSYGDKIRYLEKENGGVASALNLGIGNARGEFISWLSHDDVYYPHKLREQVKFINSFEEPVDIVFSDVEYIDDHSETLRSTRHEQSHDLKNLNHGLYPVLKGLVNGCSLLIRKNCFEKAGCFNEKLQTANDYEMWFRAFKVCQARYLSQVLLKYRLHDKQGTKTSEFFFEESNALWTDILKKLTAEEILFFESSLYSFYFHFARQMQICSYERAAEYAWSLARKEYQKRNPKVSVIMPCFNTGRFLSEAINSILSQSFIDLEFLIIDDASTDNSWEIIKKHEEKDFRIKAIRNAANKGISACMNHGLALARGRYITRMDSDDVALPKKIEMQVAFLDAHEKSGICSVNISLMDENGVIKKESLFPETKVPLPWLFLWSNPIANAPSMYRTDVIKGTMFDKKYRIAEDYDFLCRLIPKTNAHQIGEVLYRYRVHENSMFQRFPKETCANGVEISRRLAECITRRPPPKLHDVLTEYAECLNKDYGSDGIMEISAWMSVLLSAAKQNWKWTDSEYAFAREDAENRIENYILSRKKSSLPAPENAAASPAADSIVKINFKTLAKKTFQGLFSFLPSHRKHQLLFYLENPKLLPSLPRKIIRKCLVALGMNPTKIKHFSNSALSMMAMPSLRVQIHRLKQGPNRGSTTARRKMN